MRRLLTDAADLKRSRIWRLLNKALFYVLRNEFNGF